MIYKTEGIKYAGSKLKILPYIFNILDGLAPINSVLDGFSGSTRVSQAFAYKGYDVTANDISEWSECFGRCYLMSQGSDQYYQEIINYLNNLQGSDGWFTQHYGGMPDDIKKPFQVKNTRKLDAIRQEIDLLGVSQTDKAVLLTSLILALDSVDNTLGHHVSYLKKWSARSYKDMILKVPSRPKFNPTNRVFRGDVFDLITNTSTRYDLAYFDPPYGSNNEKMPPSRVRYASYYHLWTTVIRNDRPEIFGRAARREDSRDHLSSSVFEEYRKNDKGQYIAMEALDRLISSTNARHILLSYSSGGRATKVELTEIINKYGKLVKAIHIDHKKNVMSSMRWTSQWINSDGDFSEYLFLMEKI